MKKIFSNMFFYVTIFLCCAFIVYVAVGFFSSEKVVTEVEGTCIENEIVPDQYKTIAVPTRYGLWATRKHIPEVHIITVQYEGMKVQYEDYEPFEDIKEGDKVKCRYVERRRANDGKVVESYLEIVM